MRSSKARDGLNMRPFQAPGKLASSYLEATACSHLTYTRGQIDSQSHPFYSDQSSVKHENLGKLTYMTDFCQNLSARNKEKDKRRVNTQTEMIQVEKNRNLYSKNMKILEEASSIIVNLQSLVTDGTTKKKVTLTSQQKGEHSKQSMIDKSTSTEDIYVKLTFDASFESRQSEVNDQTESVSLYEEQGTYSHQHLHCKKCEEHKIRAEEEASQRKLLEEMLNDMNLKQNECLKALKNEEDKLKSLKEEVN